MKLNCQLRTTLAKSTWYQSPVSIWIYNASAACRFQAIVNTFRMSASLIAQVIRQHEQKFIGSPNDSSHGPLYQSILLPDEYCLVEDGAAVVDLYAARKGFNFFSGDIHLFDVKRKLFLTNYRVSHLPLVQIWFKANFCALGELRFEIPSVLGLSWSNSQPPTCYKWLRTVSAQVWGVSCPWSFHVSCPIWHESNAWRLSPGNIRTKFLQLEWLSSMSGTCPFPRAT